MENRKINIKAFTISETLISMIISSLVIGMSYFFIATIYDQMRWYSDTSRNTEEFAMLSYQLNKKIFEAKAVKERQNHIEIQGINDTTFISKNKQNKILDSNIYYNRIDTVESNNNSYLRIDFVISHSYGESSFPCYYQIFEE